MRLQSAAVSGLAALALSSACATAPARPEPYPYESAAETWASGARVVALSVPHRPDVMVDASYRAGSADDPPGKEGLAHLAEHLAFRARPGDAGRLWDRLEALGADFDGRTGADATDFHAAGDPEDLDALLRIEADRLRAPLAGIDAGELAREREVVVRELLSAGGPTSTAGQVDWVAARAFPGHPYGRAATPASLRGIALDDVRAFAGARYVAPRLVLVVVGPSPPAELLAAARAAFGPLTGDPRAPVAPDTTAPAPPDLDARAPGLEVRPGAVERPVLWLAWAIPADDAHGGARALAAVRFLEARLAPVLDRKERDRSLGLDLHAHAVGGAALVLGRVALRSPRDAQPIVDALRDELRFHRWEGDDLANKDRLRAQLELEAFVRLEALDPTDVARWFRATGRADYLRALPGAVGEGLGGDTARWVEEWLRPDRLVAVAVVPGGEPPADPGGGEDRHHDEPPDAEAAPGDPARAMRPPGLGGAERRRLANGLEVVIAPRPGFRVVSAHLVVRTAPAGPLQRTLEVLALRSATCADKPATVAGDRVEFGARAPTALLGDALAQVACRTRSLRIDGPAFDRARDELARSLAHSAPGVHERAGQRLVELLYPGHPYATEVTAETVRRLDAGAAGRWLASALRPDQGALVIAGDVPVDGRLWRELEDLFGGWRARGGGAAPVLPPPPLPARRAVALVDRPGWPGAELTVGVRVPPRGARDEPAFRTLARRLEDALRARLRGDAPLAYRVSVSVLEQSLGSALLVSTSVDAERAADALGAILGELAASRAPLAPDALRRAEWRAVREAGRGLGTSFRNALRLEELFVHRLPADAWDTFAARAASLEPAALAAAAGAWGIGSEAVVVIGDAGRVAPRLRAAGLEAEVVAASAAR
jgi:zinc protease